MLFVSISAVGLGALLLSANGTVLSWMPQVDSQEQTVTEPADNAGPASQLIGRSLSLATSATIPHAIDWAQDVTITLVSCTSHLGTTDTECARRTCIRFSGSCLAAAQGGEIFEWAVDEVDPDAPPVLPRRVTFGSESTSPLSWVDVRTAGFGSFALTSTGDLWSWTAFQFGEQKPDMFGGQVRKRRYSHCGVAQELLLVDCAAERTSSFQPWRATSEDNRIVTREADSATCLQCSDLSWALQGDEW
jgi:hypothetical protein